MKGLEPFGLEVLAEMNKKGMIIDVSHLSEGGFYDVARHSTKPFVASHSCARALEIIREILQMISSGVLLSIRGVAGVNFYAWFLKENSDSTFVSDIVRHVKHMVNIAGEDHVALGADLDGMDSKLESSGYDCYGPVAQKLEEVFSIGLQRKYAAKMLSESLKTVCKSVCHTERD